MKFKIIILFSFFILAGFSSAQDYFLELPSENLQKSLTSKNFPNMDGVIIVKEQALMIEEGALFNIGMDFKGLNKTISKAIIVKLFNEKAVNKYKSFSFEYLDHFNNCLKDLFVVNARILKPNGIIRQIDEDNISIVDKKESSYSNSITRTVIFNSPDMEIEDIIQIEYSYKIPFSDSPAEIYYYNDEYYTLYSNLYITLPESNIYKFVSYPSNQIDAPRIENYSKKFGTGKTYIWAVKNLSPKSNEHGSASSEDKTFFTAFFRTEIGNSTLNDWENISKEYFKNYLDKDEVGSSEIELLGMEDDILSPGIEKVDELYTSIKKYFTLKKSNYIIPEVNNIEEIFEQKVGDASDLSYIFYRILKEWELNPKVVFIRDKRNGVYHESIPALKWFDRIAINVKINGEERLYDFDKSLSDNYEKPMHLNGILAPFFNEYSFEHRVISF